jgi:predicted small integral membrane protein
MICSTTCVSVACVVGAVILVLCGFVFYHSASCHPIGARLGLMKVKIAWGDCLSTGFFNGERKKIAPLVTMSRGIGLALGDVIIAGRE